MRFAQDDPYPAQARRQTRLTNEARIAVRQHDFPLQFLSEFAREPFKVGALWPSSQALAQVVVGGCDIEPGAIVIELGPGTGAFTGLLVNRLDGRGRLLAVEISLTHVKILRRQFPRCEVVHGSAENLPRYLDGQRADCIVSGLAWGTMLAQTQDRILQATLETLKPDGQFIGFAYAHAVWLPTARRFRRQLLDRFKRVETSPIVWRNLPPAFVFRCWRA